MESILLSTYVGPFLAAAFFRDPFPPLAVLAVVHYPAMWPYVRDELVAAGADSLDQYIVGFFAVALAGTAMGMAFSWSTDSPRLIDFNHLDRHAWVTALSSLVLALLVSTQAIYDFLLPTLRPWNGVITLAVVFVLYFGVALAYRYAGSRDMRWHAFEDGRFFSEAAPASDGSVRADRYRKSTAPSVGLFVALLGFSHLATVGSFLIADELLPREGSVGDVFSWRYAALGVLTAFLAVLYALVAAVRFAPERRRNDLARRLR